MANRLNNLKPFDGSQSRDEAKKNGRLGGVRSGEARRERRKLREELEFCLGQDDGTGETVAHAICLSLIEKALGGDVAAFRAIRDTVDGKPIETGRLTLVDERPDFSALNAAFESLCLGED